MSKKKETDWITQTDLAKEKGVGIACITNWVSRGRVDSKNVYGKILVNRNTVTARPYQKK